MRMLDLFAGRCGWSKEFAARGWECVCIDLTTPSEVPVGCQFVNADVLDLRWSPNVGLIHESEEDGLTVWGFFDFITASPCCENFSIHRMKMFHPNPPYPVLGVKLFNYTRELCEASRLPYIMENVQTAQQFVGDAQGHAGSFYLWGNAVPTLLPKGLTKGMKMDRKWCQELGGHGSSKRDAQTAGFATIPPELSACVADYVERITELSQVG